MWGSSDFNGLHDVRSFGRPNRIRLVSGQSKVGQLKLKVKLVKLFDKIAYESLSSEDDVRRPQVAMDDATVVEYSKALRDLQHAVNGFGVSYRMERVWCFFTLHQTCKRHEAEF